MSVKTSKLRRGGPSMKVPGTGAVETPMNMDHTHRNGERNARQFANAMTLNGRAKDVMGEQYTENGAQGDGESV